MTIKQFLQNLADRLLDAMRPQILRPVAVPILLRPKHIADASDQDDRRHSALFD